MEQHCQGARRENVVRPGVVRTRTRRVSRGKSKVRKREDERRNAFDSRFFFLKVALFLSRLFELSSETNSTKLNSKAQSNLIRLFSFLLPSSPLSSSLWCAISESHPDLIMTQTLER